MLRKIPGCSQLPCLQTRIFSYDSEMGMRSDIWVGAGEGGRSINMALLLSRALYLPERLQCLAKIITANQLLIGTFPVLEDVNNSNLASAQ